MCDKLPYNNPRIDKCLVEEIKKINEKGVYRTILSCCGHNKYPKTIVVKERATSRIFEYFSKIELEPKKKYYKKDSEGYYYIPEIGTINEYLNDKYMLLEHEDYNWLMNELYKTHFNNKKYNEIREKY